MISMLYCSYIDRSIMYLLKYIIINELYRSTFLYRGLGVVIWVQRMNF